MSSYLAQPDVYGSYVSILNSSGTGKSCMVDELSLKIITVPMCLRGRVNGMPLYSFLSYLMLISFTSVFGHGTLTCIHTQCSQECHVDLYNDRTSILVVISQHSWHAGAALGVTVLASMLLKSLRVLMACTPRVSSMMTSSQRMTSSLPMATSYLQTLGSPRNSHVTQRRMAPWPPRHADATSTFRGIAEYLALEVIQGFPYSYGVMEFWYNAV